LVSFWVLLYFNQGSPSRMIQTSSSSCTVLKKKADKEAHFDLLLISKGKTEEDLHKHSRAIHSETVEDKPGLSVDIYLASISGNVSSGCILGHLLGRTTKRPIVAITAPEHFHLVKELTESTSISSIILLGSLQDAHDLPSGIHFVQKPEMARIDDLLGKGDSQGNNKLGVDSAYIPLFNELKNKLPLSSPDAELIEMTKKKPFEYGKDWSVPVQECVKDKFPVFTACAVGEPSVGKSTAGKFVGRYLGVKEENIPIFAGKATSQFNLFPVELVSNNVIFLDTVGVRTYSAILDPTNAYLDVCSAFVVFCIYHEDPTVNQDLHDFLVALRKVHREPVVAVTHLNQIPGSSWEVKAKLDKFAGTIGVAEGLMVPFEASWPFGESYTHLHVHPFKELFPKLTQSANHYHKTHCTSLLQPKSWWSWFLSWFWFS